MEEKRIYKLTDDLDTVKKLLYLFHPNAPIIDDDSILKMCSKANYHWMQIRGSIKGYGFVHICIDDCHDTTMTIGPGWTLAEFVKKHKAKALEFKAWRIVDDCLSKELEVSNDDVNTILKNGKYRTMNAQEWYKNYMKD